MAHSSNFSLADGSTGGTGGSFNLDVNDPVLLNQQAYELARISYNEGTLGNITGELQRVVRKLKLAWKGKEAVTTMNEINKVINAVHEFRELLSNLAYAASDVSVFQDTINNVHPGSGAYTPVSNNVKKYTYTLEQNVVGPDKPVQIDIPKAKEAQTSLEDAKNKLGTCINDVESKINELFNNWKAGKNRVQLMNNFNTLKDTVRKYQKESMTNALSNLSDDIKAFELASNITKM